MSTKSSLISGFVELFFFFDKYHEYIKGQRPPSIQDVYKSASKREHKKQAPLPSLKWPLATPKNLRVKRTPFQYTP